MKKKVTLQECNETFRAVVIEMTDPHEFFLQNVDDSKLHEIEEKIQLEYNKVQKLMAPIMDKTLCLAPFDGGLFRAQIVRKKKDDYFHVQFIDYGNSETVHANELYKVPPSVAYYKPQAIKCSLAYVECAPKWSNNLHQSALDIGYSLCWEKKLVANVVYKDDEYSYVV